MFILWLVMQSNYVNLYIGISAAHSHTSTFTAVSAIIFSMLLYTIYGLIAGRLGQSQKRIGLAIALSLGVLVGVLTSAPGSLVRGVGLSLGLSVVQAWATTLVVFYFYVRFIGTGDRSRVA